MKLNRLLCLLIIVLAIVAAAVQTGWTNSYELPLRHSDEGRDLRNCFACHEADDDTFPFQRFNHTLTFGQTHGRVARSSQRVCEMCHRPSYCSDCHGVRAGLKPSVKRHADPRFRAPHRGDYLTRHRIDGRLNPAKCFRCHGSPKTARTCATCHG